MILSEGAWQVVVREFSPVPISGISPRGHRARPIVLALRGDPRDPGHVNLPGRIKWLTIQIGNYSGRPTKAQMEWIAVYARQADEVLALLEKAKSRASK